MIVDLGQFADVAGACDLLRAVTYGVAAAKREGIEELLIHHEPQRGCPESILDLVRVEGLELRACTPKELASDTNRIQLDCFTSFPSPANLPADLKDPAGFYRLWRESYTRLRPTREVGDALERLDLAAPCLGLHIRITDKSNRRPSEYEIHKRDVNKVLRRTRRALFAKLRQVGIRRVYLACDSEDSMDHWAAILEKSGIEILKNPCATFSNTSFRQTSGTDFVTDLFAFSKCIHLVASTNSGVPVTAALINGTPPEEIIWGRYYQPLRSLESNLERLERRRQKRREAALGGRIHCPTFSFMD